MKRITTLALAFLFVFAAVFGNGNTADAASAKKVKSIAVRIGKKNVTKKKYSLRKGKSATLKISVSPKKSKKSAAFRSAKKSIVTVSKKGKITARKKGTAKITITVTGKNGKKKSTWVKIRVTEQKDTASTPSPAAPSPTQTPEESPSVPTQQPETPPSETTRSRTLIAYFSQIDIVSDGADAVTSATPAIGSTQAAALELQKQIGGDIFQIKTEKEYPVSHQECSAIAQQEMQSNARPSLSTHIDNMGQYDIVYLAYPLWWYIEPMAIRTFLEEYDFSGKTIVPLCTSLGAGIEESTGNIQNICPGANVLQGLTLRTGREDVSEEITAWLEEVTPDILHRGPVTDSGNDSGSFENPGGSENNGNEGLEEMKVKIKVGDQELIADLEDNATTHALMEKLPLTLPMMDLYGREMCYRFEETLPTEQLRSDGYEVGDLAYWPPRHSFVILYGQNGEQFSRQHLGHIVSGVEIFDGMGDVTVTIERLE